MRNPAPLASFGLAVLLAGCASTRGLQPQVAPIDPQSLQSTRSFHDATLSPAAWPAQDWWLGLGDAQLDALIHEALRDNPDLSQADARARAAQAQVEVSADARKPAVAAGVGSSGIRIPQTVTAAPIGGHYSALNHIGLTFDWDLDPWGGKRAAWEAAVGRNEAAQVDARAARLQLSVNVARAYAQLGYAFVQQDLADDEIQRSHAARDLTAQRVQAGIDSQLGLMQADVAVANAQQQAAAAAHAIDAARVALAVLLGKGPDRGLDIARPQPLTTAALTVPAELPAQLLGRRPDLVAARWRIKAAGHDIASAKAQFFPNVNLSMMAGIAALGADGLFTAAARYYEFAPALSLPLFAEDRLRGGLAARDAAYDEAVAQYNQTLVGALNAVADQVAGLRALDGQLDAQHRADAAAREAWQLSQQRYRAGVGNFLETLTAREQLLLAEQRLAVLRAQQVDVAIQLIDALGGGFHADGDAVPAIPPFPIRNRPIPDEHATSRQPR